MREDRPSRTAAGTARRRAAHQLVDHPLVFSDPFAVRILDAETRRALERDPKRFDRHPVASRLRAFMAVRSRIAEERLAEAVARGAGQYVVLGAGLDTFALRNPWPALCVFEVDHPATQAWKRRRLAESGLAEPSRAIWVPVDFRRQSIADELVAAGFEPGSPAFFSWLGVTPYLPEEVVWATLGWIATAARGSGGVTFDYVTSPAERPWIHRLRFARFARKVKAAGEPFETFFSPGEMAQRLGDLGFAEIEDLGQDALNRRYFAGRRDRLKVGALGHVVTALAGPALQE